jgi:hypothetical protein
VRRPSLRWGTDGPAERDGWPDRERQERPVLDIVDIPKPQAGPGQQLYDVSTAGVNYADTHHPVS